VKHAVGQESGGKLCKIFKIVYRFDCRNDHVYKVQTAPASGGRPPDPLPGLRPWTSLGTSVPQIPWATTPPIKIPGPATVYRSQASRPVATNVSGTIKMYRKTPYSVHAEFPLTVLNLGVK